MEAKELRNGVYVHHVKDWGERLDEIELVEWDEGIWYRIGDCVAVLDDYEPIPLTAEWLVRFGFRDYVIGDVECWTDGEVMNRFSIAKSGPSSYRLLIVASGYGVHIKWVHQLQNLYFALTGKELVLTAENGIKE